MSSRLNKRIENINKLDNLQCIEKKNTERLKRKKILLEESFTENYIITGNLNNIQEQLNVLKREKRDKQRQIQSTINKIMESSKYYFNYRGAIRRLEQLTFMEQDIQFYKTYILKKKINSNITKYNDNLLLNKINIILPIEIIRYIQSFFTYDTECSLLESKYYPFKLMNKLSIKNINKILNIIYCKDILNCKNLINDETREIIILKYEIFYNCKVYENKNLKIKRNKYDERLFFKNIVLSFQPNCLNFLYDIYKYIILLYKYEKQEMNKI